MDMDKFIMMVRDRKCLWDHREPNYHVRNIQKYYWNEVANVMGESVEELKKRWRGLRDTYRKEYKKTIHGISGDITWPFYHHLSFLTDPINTKKSYIHSKNVEEAETDFLPSANLFLEFADGHDYLPSMPIEITESLYENISEHNYSSRHKVTEAISPPKKKRKEDTKKIAEEEKASAESDYQFLMSLLPYLRDVPKHRKMVVRANLQQVFIEEQNLR